MRVDTKEFYKSLLVHSPAATVFLDMRGKVITCNPAFEKLFGYRLEEVTGKHIDELVADQKLLPEASAYTKRITEGHETVCAAGWRRSKNGRLIEVEMQGVPVTEGQDGQGVLVLYNDISALIEAQRNAQNVFNSFSTILDSLDADVYVSDMETYKILFMNQHMRAIFGGNLTGQFCHKVFHNEAGPCSHCSNTRLLDEQGVPTGLHVWEGQNPITGNWNRTYDRAIPWDDGRYVHLQVAFDITDLKKAEAELEHLATHDALTGLPNRLMFHDRLSHALSIAKREKNQMAVLFVDLDGFKSVNDSFGHACGDEFLRNMGTRMSSVIREGDTLARISGDEFGVVLEKQTIPGEAERVAHRLLEVISAPVPLAAGEASVTASIGVALFPADGETADELIRLADEAMYVVKRKSKNGVCLVSSLP